MRDKKYNPEMPKGENPQRWEEAVEYSFHQAVIEGLSPWAALQHTRIAYQDSTHPE